MKPVISKATTNEILKKAMGMIYAQIELINAGDLAMSRRHIIGEEEIKRMHVEMLVDTGAFLHVYQSNRTGTIAIANSRKTKGSAC